MNWLKKIFGPHPSAAAPRPPSVEPAKTVTPKPKPTGVPATVNLVQEEMYDFEVVGESSYQAALRAIVGPETDDGHSLVVDVWLICETNNPHDRNAVAVVVQERKVGYLPRRDAAEYRRELREVTGSIPSARTKGMIVGGGLKKKTGERMHLGIRIDLVIPPEIE